MRVLTSFVALLLGTAVDASFTKIGNGVCVDASGKNYDEAGAFGSIATAGDCETFCVTDAGVSSNDLVGYAYGTAEGQSACACYYENGKAPFVGPGCPSPFQICGVEWEGTGPVSQADEALANGAVIECFAKSADSPTSPSGSPPTSGSQEEPQPSAPASGASTLVSGIRAWCIPSASFLLMVWYPRILSIL